jgi:hypothetical protein
MKLSKKLAGLVLLVFLAGCPGGGGGSSKAAQPGSSTAASGSGLDLSNEAMVLQVDATQTKNQAALQALALDKAKRATLRLAAERRLEAQAPVVAVTVAQELALDPSQSESASFMRINSIALLTRAKTAQAEGAIALVRSSSTDNAVLLAWLARRAGGN